jgi:hypothetical protein
LDGGTFRGVQQPELDTGGIGGQAHLTAEGIDLANDVPLGLSPDGGVTAHLGNSINIPTEQQDLNAHAGRG